MAESARRSIAKAPGTFATKKIGGEIYVYFQYSQPGGKTRQLYIGKKGPAVDRLVLRFRSDRPEVEKERADLERLCAQIRVGGGWEMGARPARVLKAFADSGVFAAGAVLVGTQAYGALGNLLGVRFSRVHLSTQDVDVAGISLVAAPERVNADAGAVLERLEMGFLPVPGLDPRHPSTSFKIRGEALRIDFLTPGKGSSPVALPSLSTYAQPLRFMEYLIENPERAAVLDSGGFLVLVPTPARFALHKILIAGERLAFQEAKSAKDLAQAAQILEVLGQRRPGDLRLAADAMRDRGWEKKLKRGIARLLRDYPGSTEGVRASGLMLG